MVNERPPIFNLGADWQHSTLLSWNNASRAFSFNVSNLRSQRLRKLHRQTRRLTYTWAMTGTDEQDARKCQAEALLFECGSASVR